MVANLAFGTEPLPTLVGLRPPVPPPGRDIRLVKLTRNGACVRGARPTALHGAEFFIASHEVHFLNAVRGDRVPRALLEQPHFGPKVHELGTLWRWSGWGCDA